MLPVKGVRSEEFKGSLTEAGVEKVSVNTS